MITSAFIENSICCTMNKKTTYLIPVFAAVFALMFAFVPSLAMAELGEDMHGKWKDQKNHKMYRVVDVDGFVGSIQITEDVDRQSLKDQVTVSLSEAADRLDVMGAHIGIAVNENDDRFLVWALKSIEKDSESGIVTMTIHIVDAADVNNTAVITKEFDPTQREGKSYKSLTNYSDKIERIQEKLSEPTGDADVDALRVTFVEKLEELQRAIENGDSETISELRDELKDLRGKIGSPNEYRK